MSWRAATVVGFLALALPASGAAASDSSTIEIRRLTVDVDRDLGTQFGGRVDVTVRFRVVNRGNTTVRPTTRIRLESQIGGGTTSSRLALPPLDTGEADVVTRTAGSLLPFGAVHVVVTVRAGEEVTTASTSATVIPWLLLVAVVAAVAIVVAARRAQLAARKIS